MSFVEASRQSFLYLVKRILFPVTYLSPQCKLHQYIAALFEANYGMRVVTCNLKQQQITHDSILTFPLIITVHVSLFRLFSLLSTPFAELPLLRE